MANPAIAPVTSPTDVGLWFLLKIVSQIAQPIIPIARAIIVLTHEDVAIVQTTTSLPANADPPTLNPNHPKNSNVAPRITIGMLFGRLLSFFRITRLPSTNEAAKAPKPAVV